MSFTENKIKHWVKGFENRVFGHMNSILTFELKIATAYPWCVGYSISISACEVWEIRGRGSSLQEKVSHIWT